MTAARPWLKHAQDRSADEDLDAFYARWSAQLSSPETRRKFEGYVDLFLAWMRRYHDLEDIKIVTDASPDHLEEYFFYLQTEHWDEHPGPCVSECARLPYEVPTLKAKYDAISSFYNYAIARTLRGANPLKIVKIDPRSPDKRFVLNPWEVGEVVAAGLAKSYRSGVACGMVFGPGLRCEEVENVDIERFYETPRGRALRFKRKGANHWSDVDIPHRLRPLLDQHNGDRTEGPLIISTGRRTRNRETGLLEHTRLDSSGIWRMVHEAGKECGYNISPHDARATSITLALKDPDKPSVDRVMTYYGHKALATTLGYRNAARLPAGHLKNPYGIDWKTQAP